jgi:hypothetical protein
MTESPKPRTMGAVLLTVALTLVGVLSVNLLVARYLNHNTSNYGAWLIHHKWEMLADQEKPVDVLILGDSTCNQGINNRVLNQELGVTSLNLCTNGSTAMAVETWMLEEYINRVGAPKHVIIGHAYDVWTRKLDPSVWASIPRRTLAATQSAIHLGSERITQALLLQNFPLYSQDVTLKTLVFGPWRSLFGQDKKSPKRPSFNLDEFGFLAEPGQDRRQLRRDLAFWKKRKVHVSISKDNEQAIDRVARLAAEHNIDVLYVNGPFHKEAYDTRKVARFVDGMSAELKQRIGRHPSLRYCPKTYLFGDADMRNVDHVNEAASVAYTKQLIPLLSRADGDACN